MLSSLRTYVSDRKVGITKTAGFVGGLYLANHYIRDRLDEVKARLEQERAARDRCDFFLWIIQGTCAHTRRPFSLRRRFQQTQDDVSYTALALLPTLGDQILETMDVEALTRELQARSKARNARQQQQQQHSAQPSSSLSSSVDIVQEHDIRSENGSVSVASTGFSLAEPDSVGGSGAVQLQMPLSTSVGTALTFDSTPSKENLSLHGSQVVRCSHQSTSVYTN
jgi:peroxin-3